MKKLLIVFVLFVSFSCLASIQDLVFPPSCLTSITTDKKECLNFKNWDSEIEMYYQHKDFPKALQILSKVDLKKLEPNEWAIFTGFGIGILVDNIEHFQNGNIENLIQKGYTNPTFWNEGFGKYLMYETAIAGGDTIENQIKNIKIDLDSSADYLIFLLGYYSATGNQEILKKMKDIVLNNKSCIEKGTCPKKLAYTIADKFLKKHDIKMSMYSRITLVILILVIIFSCFVIFRLRKKNIKSVKIIKKKKLK